MTIVNCLMSIQRICFAGMILLIWPWMVQEKIELEKGVIGKGYRIICITCRGITVEMLQLIQHNSSLNKTGTAGLGVPAMDYAGPSSSGMRYSHLNAGRSPVDMAGMAGRSLQLSASLMLGARVSCITIFRMIPDELTFLARGHQTRQACRQQQVHQHFSYNAMPLSSVPILLLAPSYAMFLPDIYRGAIMLPKQSRIQPMHYEIWKYCESTSKVQA